jgi:hypothetical protein
MPVLEASYRIVWSIAKEKKLLITETLVILCTMKVAKLMSGKDTDLNIAQIPLSNCTLWLPETQKQVVEQIKKSLNIGLQLNVPNWAQHTNFAWYINENNVKEEFLCSELLKWITNVMTADFASILNDYFYSQCISWDVVGPACSNSAAGMLGLLPFSSKKVNPLGITAHCILHQDA